MRTRFLLGAVALFAFFLSPELMGQNPSTTGLSVRQEVDSEIFNLNKNIKATKTRTQAFKALEKTEVQIKAIRAKSPAQIEKDETYMNMLATSLKDIPRGKSFKTEKCDDYRSEILANYDPHGEEHPVDSIEKTLSVIKTLCGVAKD